MPQPKGRTLPLSLPRRFVCDLLHLARKVPTIPVQRRMRLAPLVAARAAAATPRPSWCAVFTKAYGFVNAAYPQLRRCYVPFPWPRLYEHPRSVAKVAVERLYEGEPAVFYAHVPEPHRLPLHHIDARLRRYKEDPLESIGSFRRYLRLCRMPWPIRRAAWWMALNMFGTQRARYLGTFGVTTYSGLGASSLHPINLNTTTLNYGVFEPDGSLDVRLTYDHRVLDGSTVARALADLERALLHEIVAELRDQRAQAA
jgi:hypothetical protein